MRQTALFLFFTLAAYSQKPELAIVEKKAGKVGFYTAAGQRVGEVKVGSFPHELAWTPDRKHLYVTDNGLLWMTDPGEGTNSISIVDPYRMTKVGIIDLGQYRRPHGLDVDRTGRIVVTIENPFGMLTIDGAARKVLRKYDVKGENPHMVIYGPDARTAWVSNSTSGNVAVVDLASGAVQTIATGKRTQGAVMTRDGKRMYVTNSASQTISANDTATRKVVGEIKVSQPGAARIAMTPDEKTLVYNLQQWGGAAIADIASMKEIAAIKIPGKPLSAGLSRDGKVMFLGLQDEDKIAVVSVTERKLVQVFETPKNAGPDTIFDLR
ncbi:MAG: hypothetical protein JNK87_35360 [Bryobacterales bacterium]|nr:hypothetical protein [Bryobacterales bacterium]